jgi:biofilm protein TabA
MKQLLIQFAVVTMLVGMDCTPLEVKAQSEPEWSKEKAEKWFAGMEWFKDHNGLAGKRKYDAFGREVPNDSADTALQRIVNSNLRPDPTVNKIEFAKQYAANPSRWDKAFAYLRNTDFSTVQPGRYPIDGNDVYALITLGPAKLSDTVMWEAHRNYEDIHYVISGKEKIGIVPLSQAKSIEKYNSERDLGHYAAKGTFHVAEPGTFFIITTEEAHKPGIKTDGYDSVVKKLVVKVKKSRG